MAHWAHFFQGIWETFLTNALVLRWDHVNSSSQWNISGKNDFHFLMLRRQRPICFPFLHYNNQEGLEGRLQSHMFKRAWTDNALHGGQLPWRSPKTFGFLHEGKRNFYIEKALRVWSYLLQQNNLIYLNYYYLPRHPKQLIIL